MTDRTSRAVAPVSALCAAFADTAERVPTGSLKTGRCADVWECPAEQAQKPERLRAAFGGERSRKRRGRRKAWRFSASAPVHFCPQCGQFWAIKTALFCEGEKWIGADFRKSADIVPLFQALFWRFLFLKGVNSP